MAEHGNVNSFRELGAWRVALDLTVLRYELAKQLPDSDGFELSAQIRRELLHGLKRSLRKSVATGLATSLALFATLLLANGFLLGLG